MLACYDNWQNRFENHSFRLEPTDRERCWQFGASVTINSTSAFSKQISMQIGCETRTR